MQTLYKFFSSYVTTFVLVLIYIIVTAIATFIENTGTAEAKYLVYNAPYFNVLNLLLVLNMLAISVKNKMYSLKKFPILLFHLAFVVVIIGAGITRFFGYSGNMHIREGQTTNIMTTSNAYLNINLDNNKFIYNEDIPVSFNQFTSFNHKIKFGDKEYKLKYKKIVRNAEKGTIYFDLISKNQTQEIVVSYVSGNLGKPTVFNFDSNRVSISYGAKKVELPFSLKLTKFDLERYPGSMSPKSYKSFVVLTDQRKSYQQKYQIFMNNVLDYGGYRFFQSSYDTDEKGTILSVNHDFWGTLITYIGYALLFLGMFLTIFTKHSRFRHLARRLNETKKKLNKTTIVILLLLVTTLTSFAQGSNEIPEINKAHADRFGALFIQGATNRIEPVNTFSSEILLKLTHKSTYRGMNPNQVLLSMLADPITWFNLPIIKVSEASLIKKFNAQNNLISLKDLFDKNGKYLLQSEVSVAYQKDPATRNAFDKEVMKIDERANVLYMVLNNTNLKIFQAKDNGTWFSPTISNTGVSPTSSKANQIFAVYLTALKKSSQSGNWSVADSSLTQLIKFQRNTMNKELINDSKLKAEIFYYKSAIFRHLFEFYFIIGLIYLTFLFLKILFVKIQMEWFDLFIRITLYTAFIVHSFGLALRWYISNHAPWSNGYESMIYIAWATLLSGIIFSKKNKLALAATTVLSGIILLVAHLSWMDPQITNLVPVLQSYWLTIHVAIITASYGFLALGAILGLLILILMILLSKTNHERISENIRELTIINEMSLIIGLFLLTIGTFLGGIWANQSWGTYWSWDPKETWSLICILVYSLVLHTRFIPSFKGIYSFNLLSLLSISSIIMTFFGVNYFLSGLHSYGKSSDHVGLPVFVYYTLIIVIIISIISFIKYKKFLKDFKYSR